MTDIDLCKAFNSVERDSLWQFLCFREIPDALINLLSALYTGTKSVVKCGSSLSYFFQVDTGVGQGR